ncbi:MAG: hypothetical protein IPL84_03555 [Chitinophagaceae bacterium]|nr:hypothetical protein [Chitinophagaceae bacterium]
MQILRWVLCINEQQNRGYNTAIGNAAMMEAYNPSGANYPFDNTAIGNDALRLNRYYGQTVVGAGALRNDTSGIYNTAVGYPPCTKIKVVQLIRQ